MIQIIGFKRVIILLVFVAINVVLGAMIYAYLLPKQTTLDRSLRSLGSQISTTRSDIDRMQVEFSQLDKQQDDFDKLKEDGFFSNQVRSEAKKIFSEIQDESKVISVVVSVKPGIIVESKEADKANYKVLKSPVEITIKSFDDTDIYRYIKIAESRIPGHLSLDSIKIERSRDVSSAVLRAISAGANPELVNATLVMSWRSLIPDSQVISDKDNR